MITKNAEFSPSFLAKTMGGRRTRTVDFEDPSVTAGAAHGKPGIDFLREVIAGTAPPSPLQVTLGFRLLEVDDGQACYELTSGEHLYGANNAVHSAVASALLDAAMGAAVTTTLDASTSYTVASLNMHLTRSIGPRTLKVLAEGWVLHRGSRLVTAEGRLTDEHGRLLAHGSCTCMLQEVAPSSVRSSPTQG